WPEFVAQSGRTGEPRPTGEPRFKLGFLARFQAHFHRGVKAQDADSGLGNRLAISVRHGGRVLVQELSDVLELHRLLADVANPDDERDRLAVVVGSMLTRAEAQPGLQATDLLAPGGERLLLLLLFRCRFHRFLRRMLLVVL